MSYLCTGNNYLIMRIFTKTLFPLFVLFLSNAMASYATGGSSTIVINEVDCDTPGTDMMEFVELYGEPGEALDGMVIVFFNGADNNSYYSADLDGYTLDANGFFVIGNAAVPNVGITFANNLMQNGPEAIVLYYGNAADWPSGTAISAGNIVDAVVYDTNDVDDPDLLIVLNPGQLTVDESGGGDVTNHSNSRVPDGGVQRDTDTYVQQPPTPGASNNIACLGGEVSDVNGMASLVFCAADPMAEVELESNSQVPGDTYYFVLTDNNNIILSYTTGTSLDISGEEPGFCRIWGLSFFGNIDPGTLEPGDALDEIFSDDCLSFSDNFIAIEKIDCTCDGGSVTVNGGSETVVVCLDEESDVLSLQSQNLAQEGSYAYVLTDENNNIITLVFEDSYDFNNGPELTCRVWGLSYTGNLDPSTTQPGLSATGILSDGECAELSSNFVTVIKQECVVVDGCTDLFFSEYIEGSSFNKALEIYNPTPQTIDLSTYRVVLYTNGSPDPQNALDLSGTLAPGQVFVIANSQASQVILNQADATSNVTFYNGNDAVELINNGVVIDVIGQVGVDPAGGFWAVGDGGTSEHTLVRKVEVTEGNTDWSIASAQWDVFAQDNVSFLGGHTAYPCIESPSAGLSNQSAFVNEGEGSYSFSVSGFNLEEDASCILTYTGGSATESVDYEFGLPIDFILEANNPAPVEFVITILEDEEIEGNETVGIALSCDNPDIIITNASLEVTILDNDIEILYYPIEEVTGVGEDGSADSLGLICELRGVVYGYNLRTSGLQFTLIDPTDGIGVFSSVEDFGYTVNEGDSLHIVGEIEQFNGLTQIIPQSVTLISSGNPLVEPGLVSVLNETTESQLVSLSCAYLTDPAQWTNEGVGFNADVSDGVNTVTLRIDAETDVFGSPAPQGVFNVTGIGSQFDATTPYTEGYQLIPRYIEDLSAGVTAGYVLSGDISVVGNDTCLISGDLIGITNWEATSEGEASYSWLFEWENGSIEVEGQEISFDATEVPAFVTEITVTLSVEDAETGCIATSVISYCADLSSGLREHAHAVALYPNPFQQDLTLASEVALAEVWVYAADGRLLVSESPRSKTYILNASDWAPGLYMAHIRLETGEWLRRSVVKH